MVFDRRPLGGKAYALVSTALEDAGFLAAFSERTGGESRDPCGSLNLGYSVGDRPAAVLANRRRLIGGLGIPPFAVAGLVHGRRLVRIGSKRAGAGFEGHEAAIAGADGLYTATGGIPIAITSADCVQLVLASPRERTVAVIHCGWRGIAAGIVARAAALFADPKHVFVAIGPAIGPCHYEVGEDVALAVAAASGAGAVTERRGGKLFLDLVGTVKGILRTTGIRRVDDTGLCTACERRRFFSHRRDGTTGRHVAIGMRQPG